MKEVAYAQKEVNGRGGDVASSYFSKLEVRSKSTIGVGPMSPGYFDMSANRDNQIYQSNFHFGNVRHSNRVPHNEDAAMFTEKLLEDQDLSLNQLNINQDSVLNLDYSYLKVHDHS